MPVCPSWRGRQSCADGSHLKHAVFYIHVRHYLEQANSSTPLRAKHTHTIHTCPHLPIPHGQQSMRCAPPCQKCRCMLLPCSHAPMSDLGCVAQKRGVRYLYEHRRTGCRDRCVKVESAPNGFTVVPLLVACMPHRCKGEVRRRPLGCCAAKARRWQARSNNCFIW